MECGFPKAGRYVVVAEPMGSPEGARVQCEVRLRNTSSESSITAFLQEAKDKHCRSRVYSF